MGRTSPGAGIAAAAIGLLLAVGMLSLIAVTAPCIPYCVPQYSPYFVPAVAIYLGGAFLFTAGTYVFVRAVRPGLDRWSVAVLASICFGVFLAVLMYAAVTQL